MCVCYGIQEMSMIDNTFGSRLDFVALLVTFSLQRLTHTHTDRVWREASKINYCIAKHCSLSGTGVSYDALEESLAS